LFAGPRPALLAQVEDDTNDPLEPMNRVFFTFNQYVYDLLLTPIAKTYNSTVPDTIRLAVGNLVDHLASPVTFVNDVLQLEFTRAMTTVARFVVNTVAGLGGIADVANDSGLKDHSEDFGQTLGVYGVGEGVYLVLPLLGPSNPRDAVGKYLVDPFFDPLGLYLDNTDRDAAIYARLGVTALDEYASIVDELEQIQKTSVDFYAAIRSLYRQRRASEISNGREEDLPPIPNYDLNFAPEGTGSGNIADVK
jgi:phospholipid-binding lipoprotein MlaA